MSRIVPADPHQPLTPEMWDALAVAYPSTGRLRVAIALALDLRTCVELISGEPVAPASVDREALKRAKERRLVRLDFAEIDALLEAD